MFSEPQTWSYREGRVLMGEGASLVAKQPLVPAALAVWQALPRSLGLGGPQLGRDLWDIRRATAATSQCDLVSPPCSEPRFPHSYIWAGVMLMTYPSSSLSSSSSCHPPSPAARRSIRCLRNIIHWNLISAFILRNATWFVVQLTMSPDVHQSNVVCPGGAGPGSEEGSGWGCLCRGGTRAGPWSP